jgi:hypothetical protein
MRGSIFNKTPIVNRCFLSKYERPVELLCGRSYFFKEKMDLST